MSFELAKQYLTQYGVENRIQTFDVSSATVELAAIAVGVEGARIAKTLSFKSGDSAILIVAAGDARIDNKKFKSEFGMKASMLSADDALRFTGHSVGGVCPFGVPEDIHVYIDESVKRFESVYPAVGSANSAIELTPDELFYISKATKWVDVCKLPETE